ncbi:hypothetical protein B0H63DRAFT_216312 [Podospora didyma]|uniref:Uncharacterized protein n=1 Tax=Podospora didyma TaxID=330526 RepID=A0AAE0NI21_9PEZI|nr:hypothetical protein B0H63DRAFT_216312 [Podospora didyma]
MSSLPRRQNSTNPRPGSSAFPRTPRSNAPPPRRSTATARPSPPAGVAAGPPRQSPLRSSALESATKTQMNQTMAIAMMGSLPVNPLPLFLPIPLGVTMLVGSSSNNKSAASGPGRR